MYRKFRMTIGRKLGLGFGALLVIVVAIGSFAIVRMRQAAFDSADLSTEHIPLSEYADHMRSQIILARLQGRNYQFTGDRTYYDQAVAIIGQMKKAMHGAEVLVQTNAEHVDLNKKLHALPGMLSNYEQLIEATDKSWTELRAIWAATTKEADEAELALATMLLHERSASEDDIATNAPKAIIEARINKINLINDLMVSFYRLRLANCKSQIFRDAKELDKGLKNAARMDGVFEKLTPLFSRAEDVQAVGQVKKAMEGYRTDLCKQSAILTRQDEINVARIKAAEDIETIANSLADASGKETKLVSVHTTEQLTASSKLMLGGAIGGVLLGILGSWFLSRLISRPIIQAASVVERVADRDLTVKLDVTTSDEIGQMGLAVNRMVEGLSQNVRDIAESAQSLAGASQELSAVSTQVSSNAEETSAQAGVVSSAAEQVSKNIQTVATGAEEMTASIGEIAKNAAEASKVAMHAAHVAEKTNQTVTKLGDSSNEIGNVIKVITSIAEQTNLLALNATIEAARAGEAGKGFAVVANEVKELAKQTAKATEDIGAKIGAIQSDTNAAVEAIQEVGQIVKQINDIQSIIASAVEEQAATTREISKNASEAAHGSTEIARNITSVSDAAKSTTQGAGQTSSAANELARLSAELKQIVDQFRVSSTTGPRRNGTHPSNGRGNGSYSNGNGSRHPELVSAN